MKKKDFAPRLNPTPEYIEEMKRIIRAENDMSRIDATAQRMRPDKMPRSESEPRSYKSHPDPGYETQE
jgi:hypothetical protein